MNDSPTRRIASARRVRSRWSSSSRCSSSSAIELNSLPSAANSSLPSVGTRLEKSPRPIARAAASRLWTSAWRVRETVIANAIASSRKPASAPITIHDVLEPALEDSRHGHEHRQLAAVEAVHAQRAHADLVAGQLGVAALGQLGAGQLRPRRAEHLVALLDHDADLGDVLQLAREGARGVDRGDDPPERRVVLVDDRVARGRDARLVAELELPRPVELQQHAAGARLARRVVQARLDPVRVLVGDRLAQLLVGHDLPPGGVRAARGLPVEVRRDPLGLGQLRVGLALLRARDDLEQDRRHGDHRDHHDDHEEQPQPIAEGRREEVAKAHACGGADWQSSRRAG